MNAAPTASMAARARWKATGPRGTPRPVPGRAIIDDAARQPAPTRHRHAWRRRARAPVCATATARIGSGRGRDQPAGVQGLRCDERQAAERRRQRVERHRDAPQCRVGVEPRRGEQGQVQRAPAEPRDEPAQEPLVDGLGAMADHRQHEQDRGHGHRDAEHRPRRSTSPISSKTTPRARPNGDEEVGPEDVRLGLAVRRRGASTSRAMPPAPRPPKASTPNRRPGIPRPSPRAAVVAHVFAAATDGGQQRQEDEPGGRREAEQGPAQRLAPRPVQERGDRHRVEEEQGEDQVVRGAEQRRQGQADPPQHPLAHRDGEAATRAR